MDLKTSAVLGEYPVQRTNSGWAISPPTIGRRARCGNHEAEPCLKLINEK
jgi:hypothetical protein